MIKRNAGKAAVPVSISDISLEEQDRTPTGFGELDRVLGGGAVKGSLVLVGGAPGIGKSTLMLQICESLCRENKVLYVSGEESEHQLKLRARRLHAESGRLLVLSETHLRSVLESAEAERPDILIVDEILSVGDIAFQQKSENKMKSMIGGGTTVLYVSHSIQSVKAICTRVIWIDHGKMVMDGKPDEVVKAYLKASNLE